MGRLEVMRSRRRRLTEDEYLYVVEVVILAYTGECSATNERCAAV